MDSKSKRAVPKTKPKPNTIVNKEATIKENELLESKNEKQKEPEQKVETSIFQRVFGKSTPKNTDIKKQNTKSADYQNKSVVEKKSDSIIDKPAEISKSNSTPFFQNKLDLNQEINNKKIKNIDSAPAVYYYKIF
jgi:hypothetical protein